MCRMKRLHKSAILYSLLFCFLLTIEFAKAQAYFQQEVHYKINVRLDDKKHELHAFETFEYTNHAPHALYEIQMHLWPNAYSDNNTALAKQLIEDRDIDFHFSDDSRRGYIDSLNFTSEGRQLKWQFDAQHKDICVITLEKALQPGETIEISTPFHVKIPDSDFSRLGHSNQSYQITQWYPKPAVYDNNGWHAMPYLNQGEFYAEFGSFDVEITLPENYVVGATGDLQTPSELKWLNKKAKKTALTLQFPNSTAFPPSAKKTKTIRYKQKDVHDFAWFADKRFHVLKSSVHLPNSGREVISYAMFTNAFSEQWKYATQYINDAIYYYSKWNGDYPYNQCTAVESALSAGAGMEYPNVTVIGATSTDFELEDVIVHEVGHNWFYGILGSNERKNPWLDEGLNSFNEFRYMRMKHPNRKYLGALADTKIARFFDVDHYLHDDVNIYMYWVNARENFDQPMSDASEDFSRLNYGTIVYVKSGLALKYLQEYLGENVFDEAMKYYYETWKFKHPSPSDFKNCIEKSTGKDLSWFFDDLINTKGKIDYAITDIKTLEGKNINKKAASYKVSIANKGDINGPVSLSGLKDGKVITKIWLEPFGKEKTIDMPYGEYDSFVIDNEEIIPEIRRDNNRMRTSGMLKKVEPLRFQFFWSPENPKRTQVFFTPSANWNNYDKLLLGMTFNNSFYPVKNFEYRITPELSTGTGRLLGNAGLSYNFFPNSEAFQRIRLSLYAKNNHYAPGLEFSRLSPSITFTLKNKNTREPVYRSIKLRSVIVNKERGTPGIDEENTLENNNYSLTGLAYSHQNNNKLKPYYINADLQFGDKLLKFGADLNLRFLLRNRNYLDVRVFAGAFLNNEATKTVDFYRFGLSGITGVNDYLFDYQLLGRSDQTGIWTQQFFISEGGFKTQTAQYANKFMLSTNVMLPITRWIGAYGDVGWTGNEDFEKDETEIAFHYATGIQMRLIPDFLEFYFPVKSSTATEITQSQYLKQIRFVINIDFDDIINRVRTTM